jgi:hypothetical protein
LSGPHTPPPAAGGATKETRMPSTATERQRFHPLANFQRFLVKSPAGLVHDAQGVLDRFKNSLDRISTTFQPTPDEDINGAPYAQRVTDEVIYQLSRLDAEAKLQRDELATPGAKDPSRLEVAIYGLSGIREQLDHIVAQYEAAMVRARKREAEKDAGMQGGPASGALSGSGIHEAHALTRVAYDEAAKKDDGFFGKLFNRGPSAKGNEKLAQDIAATYTEFSQRTELLERAVHTAQARSLDQLAVPVDELRGASQWLHSREQTFYH